MTFTHNRKIDAEKFSNGELRSASTAKDVRKQDRWITWLRPWVNDGCKPPTEANGSLWGRPISSCKDDDDDGGELKQKSPPTI